MTKPEFAAAVLLGSADARAVAVFDQPQLRRSAAIVSMLPADRAARLPDQMSADRVADIVGELPVSVRNDLLALVSSETRAALERLLRYPEHCAGTIMTNRVRLRSVGLDG